MGISYLATPYTKFPRGLDAAFEDAAKLTARLIGCGVGVVYSPIVHSHPLSRIGGMDPLDIKHWLPFCEVMLGKCDQLLVAHMESWRDSAGMKYEIDRATAWKMPIFDVNPDTLTMSRRRERAA